MLQCPFSLLWRCEILLSLLLCTFLPVCVCVCVCGRKILNQRSFFIFLEAQHRHVVAVGRHTGVGATYSLDV